MGLEKMTCCGALTHVYSDVVRAHKPGCKYSSVVAKDEVTSTTVESQHDVLTPETRAMLARQAFVEAAHWSMQTDEGKRWDAMDDDHPARRWWGDLVERVSRSVLTAHPSPAVSAPDLDAIRPRVALHPKMRDREWLRYVESVEAALAAAHAEVERLREWQREVCDVGFGYDADEPGNAAEVLAYLPIWKAEAEGIRAGRDEVRAALAALLGRIEGLRRAWSDTAQNDPMYQGVARAVIAAFQDDLAALAAAPSETGDWPESVFPAAPGTATVALEDLPSETEEGRA